MTRRGWSGTVVYEFDEKSELKVDEKSELKKTVVMLDRIAKFDKARVMKGVGLRGQLLSPTEIIDELQRIEQVRDWAYVNLEETLSLVEAEFDQTKEARSAARVAGGKAKAAAQKSTDDRYWKCWHGRFQKLIDEGKERDAISLIETRMINEQAIPPGLNKVPSRRTISRRLRGK